MVSRMWSYWKSVFIEANKITWNWLFGSLKSRIVDGVLFAVAVAFLYYTGKWSQMMDEITWLQAVLMAAVIIYVPLFILNFCRVPFLKEKRSDLEIERLKKLANEIDASPSFEIGIEVNEINTQSVQNFFNKEGISNSYFQTLCRIYIKNIDSRPLYNCRLVVEDIYPKTSIKSGVLLIPDHRGADHGDDAYFNIAMTETIFFKFLIMCSGFLINGIGLCLITEEDNKNYPELDRIKNFDFGNKYYITLAAHGDKANSRRMNLIIDAKSETDVQIYESDPADNQQLEKV